MSTDPTGLDNETCVEALQRKYINLSISRKNWCSYKGNCDRGDVLLGKDDLCFVCQYRTPLNIPKIIEQEKERNGR